MEAPTPASCYLVLSELLAHLLLTRFLLLLLRSSSRMTRSLLNFVCPARQGHLTAPNAVLSRLPRGGRVADVRPSSLNELNWRRKPQLLPTSPAMVLHANSLSGLTLWLGACHSSPLPDPGRC